MAGFWGKRKREEQAALDAQDADLARRARTALVAADERIRLTTDELAFAEAELGIEADRRSCATALDVGAHAPRRGVPPAPAEPRRDPRHPRGAAHAQRAHRAAVRVGRGSARRPHRAPSPRPIARARRAPEIIAGVRADAAHLRARIPDARDTVQRMAARYSADALKQVEANPGRGGAAARIRGAQRVGRRAPPRGGPARAGEPRARGRHRGGPARGDAARRRRDLRGRGAARRVDALGHRRGLPRRPRRRPHRPAGPRRHRRDGRARGRPARAAGRRRQHRSVLAADAAARGERRAGCRDRRRPRARSAPDPARSSTCVTPSTTPTGSSPSRATSSPATAAGSAPMRAPASPRRSASASTSTATSARRRRPRPRSTRTSASRRSPWPAASPSSRTRGCSSRSATSTPPARRCAAGQWGPPNQGWGGGRGGGSGMGGILGGLVIGSLLGDIFDG